MEVASALSNLKRIQGALRAFLLLQVTAIHWPPQALVSDGDHFDFIIVGGGSAGCVLANRLSEERDFQVLLIEAGGDPPFESMVPGLAPYLLHSDHDWNYNAAFDKNRQFYQNDLAFPLSQGKILGGGSSINSMYYVRGAPHDYQTWADQAKDQIWNYENVLPYFKKSEFMEDDKILNSKYRDFHGTNGFLHVTRQPHPEVEEYEEMFRELGYDILLDTNGNLGFGQPSYTIAKEVRQSTAFSFIRPIKHRQNLHVLRHTHVTRILFDKFKNANGVQALTKNNKTIYFMAQREVIVTAGGINSAKLLLLSGIGPEHHLKSFGIKTISDLPVGENLQDHPGAIVMYKLKKTNKLSQPPNLSQVGALLTGYMALDKSQSYPDCQAFNRVLSADSEIALNTCLIYYAFDYSICQKLHEASKGRNALLLNMNLLHSKSRGVIQLKSANPLDDPLVFLNYFSDETDLDKLASCLEDFDKIRNTTYFNSVGGELVDLKLPKCTGLVFGSREYWKCHILSTRMTLCHHSGACGMGAVLDSRLLVRGVKRLRVADSCAMPSITSGNINAPVIMLAEKAGDMIKEDNGCEIE